MSFSQRYPRTEYDSTLINHDVRHLLEEDRASQGRAKALTWLLLTWTLTAFALVSSLGTHVDDSSALSTGCSGVGAVETMVGCTGQLVGTPVASGSEGIFDAAGLGDSR